MKTNLVPKFACLTLFAFIAATGLGGAGLTQDLKSPEEKPLPKRQGQLAPEIAQPKVERVRPAKDAEEITHEGQIVVISGNRITMTGKDSKERSFQLLRDARLTLDGKACRAADLKPGMRLRVTTLAIEQGAATRVDGQTKNPEPAVPKEGTPLPRREVERVRPAKDAEEITHEGQIVVISGNRITMTGKDSKERSFQLLRDARMTLDGKACRAADLKPGMRLRVTTLATNPSAATRVEGQSKNPEPAASTRVPKEETPLPKPGVPRVPAADDSKGSTFEGQLVVITGNRITIHTSDGKERAFQLPREVALTLDGKACRAADLKPGMRLRVTTLAIEQGAAIRVEGQSKNPEPAASTRVPKEGTPLPRPGVPRVPAADDSKGSTFEGQLVVITGNRLTMTLKDGKERAFQILGEARLTRDGKACRAADLKPGIMLRVTTLIDQGAAIRIEGLGKSPDPVVSTPVPKEETPLPKGESPQPGQLASRARPQKPGDTIAPFRKKWGYDSKTSTPKAKLWSMTDSAWLTADLAVLPLAGSAAPTLAHRAGDGSLLPIGDSSHRADPGATSVTTQSSTAAVIHWPQSSTDPSMGSLVDLEAEVDVLTDRPARAALCIVQNGTVFSGPAVNIAPAKTFQRVNLPTLVGAKLVRIAGVGENPLATGQAYSFGLVLTPNPGTSLQVVGDNFEVRLATGCSGDEKQREQARAKQASLDKAALLKAVQALRLEQVNKDRLPGLTSDEIQREKLQYEAGIALRPVDNDKLINKLCCNDAEPTFDERGNLVIEGVPVDAEVEGTANFVEEELPLADVFAGADTRTDAWLGKLPCSPSIGNFIPQEIKDIEALTPEEQLEKFSGVDSKTRQLLQTSTGMNLKSDWEDFPNLATTDLAPTPAWVNNNNLVWIPPATAKLAFEGRDIVFVHGLKLLHVFDALVMDRSFAKVKWQSVPGAGSNALYAANLAFFPNLTPNLYNGTVSTTNYMGDSAFKNWIGDNSIKRGELNSKRGSDFAANLNSIPALASEPNFPVDGHVGQFLFGNGYQNRFMIASYSSYDRLDAGVHSLLTQVGMAMSDGIGVYNPTVAGGLTPTWTAINTTEPHPSRGFGATGLVFITQSTGALLVDVAMSRATQTPQWKVSYIPEFTRAHISAQGASGGSHVASLANMFRIAPLGTFKTLAKKFFDGIDPFTGLPRETLIDGMAMHDRDRYSEMLPGTIIQDLRPQIVWQRHRLDINSSPIQTLVMNGGHPTTMAIQKYWLHPGFDDNTVNTTGTVASRTHWHFWPHGALASVPAMNFDLGLFGTGSPLPPVTGPFGLVTVHLGTTYPPQQHRAIGYYIDQRIDPLLTAPSLSLAGPLVRTHFQASAGGPFKSPSGMVQYSTVPMLLTPWDPYWRAKNHFGFLSVAGDHFEATHDQGSGSDVRQTGAWVGEENSDIRYPEYTETLDQNPLSTELNVEESMAVTSLQPYAPHTPPGLLAHPQISTTFPNVANSVLLKDPYFPHVWLTRGCYIEIKVRWPKKNPKWQKTWTIWVFKRSYDLLKGWRDKMQFDYVYGTTLNNQSLGGVLRQ